MRQAIAGELHRLEDVVMGKAAAADLQVRDNALQVRGALVWG
jgi:hypothetical protein